MATFSGLMAGPIPVLKELGKSCPKVGLRVVYIANPVSAMLSRNQVSYRTHGTVTSMPVGGGRRVTCTGPMPGDLIYVKWDNGDFVGVPRHDVRKEG